VYNQVNTAVNSKRHDMVVPNFDILLKCSIDLLDPNRTGDT